MTQFRAILDMINFPVVVPGNLECRLIRCTFTDDVRFIDQGNRATHAGGTTRGTHRFIVSCNKNATDRLAEQCIEGYELPSSALIDHIAVHEHDEVRLERRRSALKRDGLRLNVRALGFDVIGAGQLAVGLGKLTVRAGNVSMIQKANVTLYPGDDIEALFKALDGYATMINYETISDDDKSLVRHAAEFLWRDHAADPSTINFDFDTRMRALGDWRQVPIETGAFRHERAVH